MKNVFSMCTVIKLKKNDQKFRLIKKSYNSSYKYSKRHRDLYLKRN